MNFNEIMKRIFGGCLAITLILVMIISSAVIGSLCLVSLIPLLLLGRIKKGWVKEYQDRTSALNQA